MCDLIPLPLEIPFRLLDSHYFLNLNLFFGFLAHLKGPKECEIHAIGVNSAGSAISNREAILKDFYFDDVIDIIFHRSLLRVL